MTELKDHVEAHIAESAHRQKEDYDSILKRMIQGWGPGVVVSAYSRQTGSTMRGELDSIRNVKSPVTVEISDREHAKVVHTNRLQQQTQPRTLSHSVTSANSSALSWEPPRVDHFEEPAPQAERRYPPWDRHTPVRFGY